MDAVGTWALEVLKQYGLAGLVIAALGFIAWRLWKVIEAKDAKIEALQDKHVERTEVVTRALVQSTEAAEEQAKSMNTLAEVVKEVLRERRTA